MRPKSQRGVTRCHHYRGPTPSRPPHALRIPAPPAPEIISKQKLPTGQPWVPSRLKAAKGAGFGWGVAVRDRSTRVCKAARSWDPLASPLWGAPQWEVRRAGHKGLCGSRMDSGPHPAPGPLILQHTDPRGWRGPAVTGVGLPWARRGVGSIPRLHPQAPWHTPLPHLSPNQNRLGGFSPGPSHFPSSAPFPHRAPGVWLNWQLLSPPPGATEAKPLAREAAPPLE